MREGVGCGDTSERDGEGGDGVTVGGGMEAAGSVVEGRMRAER
jgi:hypothetical protein